MITYRCSSKQSAGSLKACVKTNTTNYCQIVLQTLLGLAKDRRNKRPVRIVCRPKKRISWRVYHVELRRSFALGGTYLQLEMR